MSIPVAGSGTAFYINLYLATQIGSKLSAYQAVSFPSEEVETL